MRPARLVKRNGEEMRGEPVELIARHNTQTEKSPYERLLGDAVRGDRSLFTQDDSVEAAWRVVDPILSGVRRSCDTIRAPGDPAAATSIVDGDDTWHDPAGRKYRAVLNDGDVVFLLDVDNTLLDNDRFTADLGDTLERAFGAAQRARYWDIFSRRRAALGLADYLGSLQDFRSRARRSRGTARACRIFCSNIRFATGCFRGALEAMAHLREFGQPVVLSDGDIVFQPRKIQRSGIWAAVEGSVLIYLHKEKVLDHVQRRYPAKHYVMVDDKANLLAAMKSTLGAKLTTVFVRQGHYALAPESAAVVPRAGSGRSSASRNLINLSLNRFQGAPMSNDEKPCMTWVKVSGSTTLRGRFSTTGPCAAMWSNSR